MKNTKSIMTLLVLAAAIGVSFLTAQAKDASSSKKAKSKRAAKTSGDPKAIVAYQVRRYASLYRLSEAEQAKLEKILLAQQKDLADFEKVHGSKIKVVDEKIKALRDKIAELEASKGVHAKARKELELDHQAELARAITPEHKANRLAAYLKGYSEALYWKHLPKEVQASLDEQSKTIAAELVATGKGDSRNDVKAARAKLQKSIASVVSPEMRQTAETQQLKEMALRSFARYELTDDQKIRIGDLCDKNIKDRALIYSRYKQLSKDYAAAREALSKGKHGSYSTIREEIAAKVLTEEQRKKLPQKRRSSKRDKSSSKKDAKKKSTT